jgi:hypothetical protein
MGSGEERKNVANAGMGAKTQNGGPHLLVLSCRAGGVLVVKDNGYEWSRWLLKQGGVILPTQITGSIGVL